MENIIVNDFINFNIYTHTIMPIIAVYEKPLDFPDKYVARLWNLNKSTQYIVIRDTLEEIRLCLPDSMTYIPPFTNDDPVIIETWV